ncbi:MAG: hypothetical protein J5737_04060 [Bacteroidales bacterium]|nr:hypothetical protein [Bacteroidales bacterium]
MKRILSLAALSALLLLGTSCAKSRIEQMQMAKDVVISCSPEILEIKAGKIPATVTVECPKGYFHPQATMDVLPVLVYEGGESAGRLLQYQGDKVKDNYKPVSSKGDKITERLEFKYVPGCEKARLELRATVHYKDKSYPIDPVKVADGCIATYQLANPSGIYVVKPDGYEPILYRTTEGRILYDVGSDKVNQDQFETNSMVNYKNSLEYLQTDERTTIKDTKIVAYTSPEGGKDYNESLSDKRAGTAQKAWDKVASGLELSGVEVESMGQDWEGFREAVAKSNIQDKDLILRVLSMYSDPAVRESEIRNLSAIYEEINKRVFPELRRARLVTSTEWRNYDDQELLERAEKNGLDRFDEPSILHLATLADTPESKESLYKLAIEKFNSDTARYNLAMLYLDQGRTSLGGAYLSKIKEPDADVLNATGVVAMRNEDWKDADMCFWKSGNDEAAQNRVAMDILRGDYELAAKDAEGVKGVNAATAYILGGNLDKASAALEGIDCARADYARAVIAARKGQTAEARRLLDAATASDPALGERAARDIEFAALAN